MLRTMPDHLKSRRLYIADLATRQHAMEAGIVTMAPLAYRVLSRRLREALAGLPEIAARAGLPDLPPHLLPLVAEVLETRHFDHHGRLYGLWAPHCQAEAAALFARLRRPPPA
jgi:hypothetical protein